MATLVLSNRLRTRKPTRTQRQGWRPIQLLCESLEDRTVPSGVTDLDYTQFQSLTPDQVPQLTTDQIASIPSSYWFATMSADARAALTAPQVQALNTANVDLGLLTSNQVAELSTAQIQQTPYWDFQYLNASQVTQLTVAQVASLPDSYWFSTVTADARAALTAPQVQALNTASVDISLLTSAQVAELSTSQLQQVSYWDFQYLNSAEVTQLTVAQVASIPDTYWLTTMAADARAALSAPQVQALDTAHIDLSLLTSDQVAELSTDQLQQVPYWDFQYLNATQVGSLTTDQIASIPDSYWFSTMSPDARAALTASQVQALNTASIDLSLLTTDQIAELNTYQVQQVQYWDFQYLTPTEVTNLTLHQMASIPNLYWFNTMSPESQAAFSPDQLAALQFPI
jgi:hypothetical protein